MYLAIEMWQESGLSQHQFCSDENIAKSTFGYWLKKYRNEKGRIQAVSKDNNKAFIPVKVSKTIHLPSLSRDHIEINYPGGVQVICPVGMDIQQIKTLIGI